jgi:hypothetical protein
MLERRERRPSTTDMRRLVRGTCEGVSGAGKIMPPSIKGGEEVHRHQKVLCVWGWGRRGCHATSLEPIVPIASETTRTRAARRLFPPPAFRTCLPPPISRTASPPSGILHRLLPPRCLAPLPSTPPLSISHLPRQLVQFLQSERRVQLHSVEPCQRPVEEAPHLHTRGEEGRVGMW